MSLNTRLDALKERHASLETRIFDEDHRPQPDTEALMRLKLEKLRLKDEMERLRTQAD
ncbi:YdcH family protein [Rhodopila sp.]|uniref:YdcH family protein n=1 Tax=Rhodopila sp. TaxID=2480087 RepID=UPI003D0BE89F